MYYKSHVWSVSMHMQGQTYTLMALVPKSLCMVLDGGLRDAESI